MGPGAGAGRQPSLLLQTHTLTPGLASNHLPPPLAGLAVYSELPARSRCPQNRSCRTQPGTWSASRIGLVSPPREGKVSPGVRMLRVGMTHIIPALHGVFTQLIGGPQRTEWQHRKVTAWWSWLHFLDFCYHKLFVSFYRFHTHVLRPCCVQGSASST